MKYGIPQQVFVKVSNIRFYEHMTRMGLADSNVRTYGHEEG